MHSSLGYIHKKCCLKTCGCKQSVNVNKAQLDSFAYFGLNSM